MADTKETGKMMSFNTIDKSVLKLGYVSSGKSFVCNNTNFYETVRSSRSLSSLRRGGGQTFVVRSCGTLVIVFYISCGSYQNL